MQSKLTAMALALAFATVTALPAIAFTLNEKPVGGDEVGATVPDPLTSPEEQVDREMNVLVLPSAPQVPGAEQGIGVGELTPPPMPASPDGMVLQKVRTVPSAAAPSSIKPRQGIQGQKVAPITRTLQ